MEIHQIQTEHFKYHIVQTGNGRYPIFFFHGFNQNVNQLYLHFESWLTSGQYSIYLISLPFHIETSSTSDIDSLDGVDISTLGTQLMRSYGVPKYVIGFSIGARFASHVFYQINNPNTQLILMAPQGIQRNFYLYILNKWPFHIAFKHWLTKPMLLTKLSSKLNHLRCLSDRTYSSIYSYYISTPLRYQAYYSWKFFNRIPVNYKEIFARNTSQIIIVMGQYDRIFPIEKYQNYLKKHPNISQIVLECGHLLTSEESLLQIYNALNP